VDEADEELYTDEGKPGPDGTEAVTNCVFNNVTYVDCC
jgi:hypothetical protein